MSPFYLTESAAGPAGPRVMGGQAKAYRQLVAVGSLSAQNNLPAPYAGCGIDLSGEALGETFGARFEFPGVTRLYLSLKEYAAARRGLGAPEEIIYQYVACDRKNPSLESPEAHLGFCRFAFQAPSQSQAFFDELAGRLQPARPSAAGEPADGPLAHYALDEGRKFQSFFNHPAIGNIRVGFHARHLFYGPLPASVGLQGPAPADPFRELRLNETLRLDLGSFEDRFFEFLRSPGRFNYTPFILAEKRRQS